MRAVGKQANCQVSVELVVSDGFVAAPVGGRLYLPQSWIDDPQRCAKAGVPSDVGFATKNEIALTLIEQALADQVVPAPVLGDAAYGDGFAFRAHLRELNLEFFLQVTPEEHKAWIQEVPTTLKGKYQRPFAGPEQVLDYVGRYTHRVAISNNRLLDIAEDKVTFRYKDYRHDAQQKTMTVEAEEFIRRFLLHVLPEGFQRIRYYGFLANRYREEKLARCRELLDMPAPEPPALEGAKDYRERYQELIVRRSGSAQSVTKVACL